MLLKLKNMMFAAIWRVTANMKCVKSLQRVWKNFQKSVSVFKHPSWFFKQILALWLECNNDTWKEQTGAQVWKQTPATSSTPFKGIVWHFGKRASGSCEESWMRRCFLDKQRRTCELVSEPSNAACTHECNSTVSLYWVRKCHNPPD